MSESTEAVPVEDELYTATEVAAYFKVNVKTVYTWAKRGKLPIVRTPSGGIRVTGDVMDRLVSGDFDAED